MFARRGPGLVRAAATTAVVAGTAGAVRHRQDQKSCMGGGFNPGCGAGTHSLHLFYPFSSTSLSDEGRENY